MSGFLVFFRFALTSLALLLPLSVLADSAPTDDGVSVADIQAQVAANNAPFENFYRKTELASQVTEGSFAGKDLGTQTVEMWAFVDAETGHRKVKIRATGKMPVAFMVDVEAGELSYITSSRKVITEKLPDEQRAKLLSIADTPAPALGDPANLERLSSRDRDSSNLIDPSIAAGADDTLGIQETPEERPHWRGQKKGFFEAKNKPLRNKRGKLKAWHGKRVRGVQARVKGKRVESDVDQGTGLVLESRIYEDKEKGKMLMRQKVTRAKRNERGVVEAAESETEQEIKGSLAKNRRRLLESREMSRAEVGEMSRRPFNE